MENTIALAELVGAVLGSLCLAGLLEWLCLRGLMRLMPARAARPVNPARVRPAARKLLRVSHLEMHS
jgi:hypothetical protein